MTLTLFWLVSLVLVLAVAYRGAVKEDELRSALLVAEEALTRAVDEMDPRESLWVEVLQPALFVVREALAKEIYKEPKG